MINNQRGQGTVESCAVAIFLFTVVLCFLMICYLTFSSYWVKHQLHEAVICYEATNKEMPCGHQAQKDIERLLPKTNSRQVEIFRESRKVFARYKLNIPFASLLNSENQIQFEESLGL
jgi:hypothetical protein